MVFGTLSANTYAVFVIPEGFVENIHPFNESLFQSHEGYYEDLQRLRNLTSDQRDQWNMTNRECIAQYSKSIVTGGNLWAVTSNISLVGQPIDIFSGPAIDLSKCVYSGNYCKLGGRATKGSDSWAYDAQPISYCLSEPIPERCTLQYSMHILIVVVICNALKVLVMLFIFWKQETETLVTLGDAISSFLDNPDPTTAGQCLASKRDIRKEFKPRDMNGDQFLAPKEWQSKGCFWFAAPSGKRWLSTILP